MTVQEVKAILSTTLREEVGLGEKTSQKLADMYPSIQSFCDSTMSLEEFQSVVTKRYNEEAYDRLNNLKAHLKPEQDYRSNLLLSRARRFIRKQMSTIEKLTLDDLLPNPFLIRALHLTSPREVIRFTVYATVTRSIVTSWGYEVEKILAEGSSSVRELKSGWDLSAQKGAMEHLIQVKSGPIGMNKDMIDKWKDKFDEIQSDETKKGYIAFTYGKREMDTSTLSMIKRTIDGWKDKLLVGPELWEFVSESDTFQDEVLEALRYGVEQVMGENSFTLKIDDKVNALLESFTSRYGEGAEGIQNYLEDII